MTFKRLFWLCGMMAALLVAPATAKPLLDESKIAAARFGNDAPWYENNIPFFESSDPLLDRIYYYRWQIYRAHQRDLGSRGYITTEFLDDVSWQLSPQASLNDATGFHIYEGRWLRNRRYVDDYIDYMFSGGNDRHFAEAISDAAYARFLVDGDLGFAAKQLDSMKRTYAAWDDHYDAAKGLYWIEPLLDATEYTISSIDASGGKDGFRGGEAFRPSINSYMFANARAIGRLAALTGDAATAKLYSDKAEALRANVLNSLWSTDLNHFIDRYKVDNEFVKYWQPVRGRELVGYLPWTYGLAPDDSRYAEAWKYALSPDGLAGPAGLRTVGPSYEYYMRQYRYEAGTGLRECQWNGPVWPFQTTQALIGIANLLNDDHESVVSRSDYTRLLRQYARLHLRDGRPDLEEDYDPATGNAIVGLARSHHYFHSGFDDLIISGLAGIRPHADDVLEVNPLVPTDPADPQYLRSFALQDVPYHGHVVGVVFDADGKRYGLGAGLFVLVDGRVATSAPKLGRLLVKLTRKAPSPIERRVDLAMNLNPYELPRGDASVNANAGMLHQALDGRVWFFPEMPNGWSTQGSAEPEQWFSVDFGTPQTLSAAELSFYGDGRTYLPPDAYGVEVWQQDRWVAVTALRGAVSHPLANGVNKAAWLPVKASRLRVLFHLHPNSTMRLVELKVF